MRKKSLLSKFALLVTALVMGVSSAWAEEKTSTLTFKEACNGSGTADDGVKWTVSSDGKESTFDANKGIHYGTGSASVGYIELSTSDISSGTITKVVVEASGASGVSADLTVTVGGTLFDEAQAISSTNTAYTFAGSAKAGEIVVKLAKEEAAPKAIYVKSVAVTYKTAGSKDDIASITDLSPLKIDLGAEGTFTPEITLASGATSADYTLTLAGDNDEILLIEGCDYLASETTTGTVNVTVTVTPTNADAYEAVSETFEVAVVDPNAPGAEKNPYTVAQAIAQIKAGNTDECYVKGLISTIASTSVLTGGYLTYYISDDGTTTDQLQVFKGKGLNDTEFTSVDDIKLGDEVVVYGPLFYYNNKTPEINTGNYLVSKVTKLAPELSFTEAEFTVSKDETSTFVAPTLNNPNNVAPITWSWTGSPNTVKNFSETDGTFTLDVEGTVTITVSFAGDNTYNAGSASYAITVYDPNVKGSIYNPYTVAEVIDGTAKGSGIYVKGFIVGSYNSKAPRTGSSAEASNLALADSYVETDGSNTIPVQLSNNTTPRTEFNVVDNPYNIGVAQVVVKANADTYFSTKGLKNTSEITKIAEQVSISDAGMATYYTDCALDFSNFADMQAFTASLDGNELTFTRVNKVPANTAVLLYNPNGGAATNLVPVTDSPEAVRSALQGTLVEKTGEAGEYILLKGQNGPGFYQATGKTIAAHKAYVNGPTSKTARFFGINLGGEATGINAAAVKAIYNEGVYNLNGQRVVKAQKGLYIVNGKKMVVR